MTIFYDSLGKILKLNENSEGYKIAVEGLKENSAVIFSNNLNDSERLKTEAEEVIIPDRFILPSILSITVTDKESILQLEALELVKLQQGYDFKKARIQPLRLYELERRAFENERAFSRLRNDFEIYKEAKKEEFNNITENQKILQANLKRLQAEIESLK